MVLHQHGPRPTVFIPRWTTHSCILYQVCATRGAHKWYDWQCLEYMQANSHLHGQTCVNTKHFFHVHTYLEEAIELGET